MPSKQISYFLLRSVLLFGTSNVFRSRHCFFGLGSSVLAFWSRTVVPIEFLSKGHSSVDAHVLPIDPSLQWMFNLSRAASKGIKWSGWKGTHHRERVYVPAFICMCWDSPGARDGRWTHMHLLVPTHTWMYQQVHVGYADQKAGKDIKWG